MGFCVSNPDRSKTKAYLVGGGVASLAAAAILIRDGDLIGRNITVFEELSRLGGSLDGSGDPERGYMIRGGRMLEAKFLCTFDLFSSIPTLDGSRTVTQEIFQWNEVVNSGSKSRLVRDGQRVDAPEFGLAGHHVLAIEKLVIAPERMLGHSRIQDHFDDTFFRTNFWIMWATTFAFQPWHSAAELRRYLIRFTHLVSGFNRLKGVMSTVHNQYDSLVRPLRKWLDERGVRFEVETQVTDLEVADSSSGREVEALHLVRGGGRSERVEVAPEDLVLVTLGSMTEASDQGSMDGPAGLKTKEVGGAWTLWERIAEGRPELGRPGAFDNHIDQSKWLSFTTTLKRPDLINAVRDFTGNVPGEGGLVTFAQSGWLMSIVVPHQPHFIGQPSDMSVFWGYGLRVDALGDFVKKPMAQCSGRELLAELLGHLNLQAQTDALTADAICLPCMMPFITSQFLPRGPGDRPMVHPDGYVNLGLLGQFVELADDVVFTVEYSVRSAMAATYSLLGLKRHPPAVYKGQLDPRNLLEVLKSLHT